VPVSSNDDTGPELDPAVNPSLRADSTVTRSSRRRNPKNACSTMKYDSRAAMKVKARFSARRRPQF